jgi:hypothetical protein
MERSPSIMARDAEDARVRPEQPLLLRWTDPQSGEELAVVMYGTPEFALELAELGFEVREAPLEDETASSLFVVIRQSV